MKTLNILIGRLITKKPTFLSFISQSPAIPTKLHQIYYEAVWLKFTIFLIDKVILTSQKHTG